MASVEVFSRSPTLASISASMRLMKKLATLATRLTSPPALPNASSPSMKAVATRWYASGAKSSVTLTRSEEHTSELQSLAYLVCRLLLEKKKKKKDYSQK